MNAFSNSEVLMIVSCTLTRMIFFVPHVNPHEALHYYIENWCRIGSCHFEWLQFHPDCGLKHWKSLFDGNVTNLLNTTLHIRRMPQKSIHLISDLVDLGTHVSYRWLHGKSPPSNAVVAHIRKKKLSISQWQELLRYWIHWNWSQLHTEFLYED